MSLQDIVGGSGATGFALIALVVFFLIFLGVLLYVVLRRRDTWEHERRLPLDDGEPSGDREDKQR